MYEQDIELTRLLLEKLQGLDTQSEKLRAEIHKLKADLEETRQVRDERESYLDVLSRAAKLLERADLQVDSPETTELDERINGLQGQLESIDQEVLQYRKLVDELRERAPKLLEVAAGDEGPADDENGDEEVVAGPPFDQPAPTFEVEAPEDSTEIETPEHAAETPAPAPEAAAETEFNRPTELAQLFDLKDLKVKEAFTYGLGAAYIVDATSVLDRVPHYDRHFLAMHEDEIRDALISDLDRLSREISGDFYVIFTTEHVPETSTSSHVKVESAGGDGSKEMADTRLLELVKEMTDKDRTACVVTGDSTLAETVRNQNVHVIPLGNFFRT